MTDRHTSEAVNKLLEEFRDPFAKSLTEPGGTASIVNQGVSALPTVVVVADDAPSWIINAAEDAEQGWYLCDGTDDHQEIQAAIDSLPFDGGRVILSAGEFHPDWDQIKADRGIHIYGMGREATVIDMNDTNPTTGTGPAVDLTGLGATVRHLRIDMPSNGLTTQIGVEVAADSCVVEDVVISTSQGDGIYVAPFSNYTHIIGCYIEECLTCIHAQQATDTQIIGNVLFTTTAAAATGVYINRGDADLIANNTIIASGSTGYGVQADSAGSGTEHGPLTIVGNVIDDSGISLDAIRDYVVANNVVFNAWGVGIDLNNSYEGLVSGNHVQSPLDDGIQVGGAFCEYIVIEGNTVVWSGSDGIVIFNTAKHITVSGNVVTNTTTDGIVIGSVSWITVADNNLAHIGRHGIWSTGGEYHTFTGNTIYDTAQHGFLFSDTDYSLIANNFVHDWGTGTTNTYDAIFLENDSDRNDIHGNKIRPPGVAPLGRYGINVNESSCDLNRVGDNDYGIIADYGTHPFNDTGTGTRYPTAVRAALSVPGSLSIGTGAARWPMPEAGIIIDAHATVGTAPSGGPVTLDINKNGTTMYATATNPSIADATNVGSKAPADQTTFAENDYLTLDLDAVNGAADLTCIVRYLVA